MQVEPEVKVGNLAINESRLFWSLINTKLLNIVPKELRYVVINYLSRIHKKIVSYLPEFDQSQLTAIRNVVLDPAHGGIVQPSNAILNRTF